MKIIVNKLLTLAAAFLLAFSLPLCAADENKAGYALGDSGPGGGWVFYDKGAYTDGWRYLEAGQEDLDHLIEWGNHTSIPGAGGTAIGTGKSNTKAIVDSFSNPAPDGRLIRVPAILCAYYTGGGKTDWFLPSRDELNEMYQQLQAKGVRHFKDDYYWSSSEDSAAKAWLQNFATGNRNISFKTDFNFRVRPIRSF